MTFHLSDTFFMAPKAGLSTRKEMDFDDGYPQFQDRIHEKNLSVFVSTDSFFRFGCGVFSNFRIKKNIKVTVEKVVNLEVLLIIYESILLRFEHYI